MQITVYSKEVTNGKAKFTTYYCKDKNGIYYDVKFTKNSSGQLPFSAIIEVEKNNVFIATKDNGFKKLVINGPYEVIEQVKFKEQELPVFD